VLAAAALVFASSVGFAHATPPAANGSIVFQRYLFRDHPLQADIWAANADG